MQPQCPGCAGYPQDREKRPQKRVLHGDFCKPFQSSGSDTVFWCSVYAEFPFSAPFVRVVGAGAWWGLESRRWGCAAGERAQQAGGCPGRCSPQTGCSGSLQRGERVKLSTKQDRVAMHRGLRATFPTVSLWLLDYS